MSCAFNRQSVFYSAVDASLLTRSSRFDAVRPLSSIFRLSFTSGQSATARDLELHACNHEASTPGTRYCCTIAAKDLMHSTAFEAVVSSCLLENPHSSLLMFARSSYPYTKRLHQQLPSLFLPLADTRRSLSLSGTNRHRERIQEAGAAKAMSSGQGRRSKDDRRAVRNRLI